MTGTQTPLVLGPDKVVLSTSIRYALIIEKQAIYALKNNLIHSVTYSFWKYGIRPSFFSYYAQYYSVCVNYE